MAATIKLDIVGQLESDHTLYVMCLEHAARFPASTFTEYASRVEGLVEIFENVGCQRMMPEHESTAQ